MLLSRDQFREGVFQRDNHRCVFCGSPAVDAHHIIERRLFPDGGYYIDNGISVCEEHHLACERTDISVEEARLAGNITKRIIPPQLYDDQIYDKWGNPIKANGERLIGELFFDESVQKIIKSHLHKFTHYVKYNRTYHLPWSEGIHNDDRIIPSLDGFIGQQIVVTEKLDGENTTMYSDYIHARSIDSKNHPSRNWVKNYWSTISHDIPEHWRICGENMFAKHSIKYTKLQTYFYGFSIWNEKNVALSWNDTLEWFKMLGIQPVPILYQGIFDENTIKNLWKPENWNTSEGYVVRTERSFNYGEFRKCVAKFVRKGHVNTIKHWMNGQVLEPNELFSK